jgi:DNA-binding NtrC family response regulator
MRDSVYVAVFGSRRADSALKAVGCQPLSVSSPDKISQKCAGRQPRLFLVEAVSADSAKALALVEALRKAWPLTDVVVWAPRATASLVRDAFKAGAKDVVATSAPARIGDAVKRVLDEQQFLPMIDELANSRSRGNRFESMLSRSNAMWDLFELCTRVAPSDATALIVGETGTGKELLARAIHRRSGRSGRFVAANCASLSPQLIESELFGHEKGAFTGASRGKTGLVRHADGGTLFLDEIADMPDQAQLSLLRVLQEKRIRPVGGQDEISVDVRIVAATQVPLEEAVRLDDFREDLFYRLDVIRMSVPPLRERPEDIVYLFGHFAKKLAKHYELAQPGVSDGFLDAMIAYDWPGNVRQLENFAERVVLSQPKKLLGERDFSRLIQMRERRREKMQPVTKGRGDRLPPAVDPEKTLQENMAPVMEQIEREYLESLLRKNDGRIVDSAQQAGISRRTLLRKLKAHKMDKADFK